MSVFPQLFFFFCDKKKTVNAVYMYTIVTHASINCSSVDRRAATNIPDLFFKLKKHDEAS